MGSWRGGDLLTVRRWCGKVGSEVARRGTGLGFANVIAYDPYASAVKAQALGVKLVSWEEALAQGDFFSLHMPMTPQTKVCCLLLQKEKEALLL